MAENKIILKVSLDGAQKEISNLEKLQAEIAKLAAEKKRLNKNEKELTAAINKSGVATTAQNEALKKIYSQQVQNNAALKLNQTARRENEQQVKRNTDANNLEKGSLRQLQAQITKDQYAFDRLSKSEQQNINVGGKLQKSITKQNDALLKLESSTGRNQRNVGNYGAAMNDVLPVMGSFGGQIQTVQRTLGAMKGAIAKVSTAQKGMVVTTKATNTGLKAFRLALIATGIGAIVVVLGSLIAAFASTQRGVDALTSVMRPLQEVFQSIIGFVQDLATGGLDRLKKAFSDPKQAVIDLGNAIKQNFINRFTGGIKLIQSAAKIYINSFKLIGLGIKKALADVPLIGKFIDKEQLEKDLKETKKVLSDSFSELKDGAIEVSLGVDADKVKEAAGKVGEFFSEAAARGSEIDRLQKDIERNAISLNRQLKTGERIYEEQKKIAEDTNLIGEEGARKRLAAAAAAQTQLNKNVKLQTDQINRELTLAQLKTEANDTDRDDQKEIQDLIAQKEEVEAKAIKKGLLLRNKANSIAQKAEKDKQKLIDDGVKADEKAIKDKSDLRQKAIDDEIKTLELAAKLEEALQDDTLKRKNKTAEELKEIDRKLLEEKFEKEKELLDKINALKLEKVKVAATQEAEELTKNIPDEVEREKEKARIIGEAVTEQELENAVVDAEKKKEQREVTNEQEIEDEKVKEEGKKLIKDAAVQAGEKAVQEVFNNQNRRIDEGVEREVEALNLKREAGEISEEEFAKKRLQIDKEAFAKRKRLSQVENIINFAVGVGKTIANLGLPLALPALGVLGIQAATQAAVIASQKFAKGGVLNGASHAQGGIDLGNNQEGEGGEAIINKRSTAKHLGLLSAINQDGGGVSLTNSTPNFSTVATKYANGGVGNFGGGSQIDLTDLENRITNAMSTIKVQNVASETTGVSNRVEQIQDSASF